MKVQIAAALLCGGALMASVPGHPNQKLDALMERYWEYTLRVSPETATAVGDPRYNNRLSDVSLPAIKKDLAAQKTFLHRAEAFRGSSLDADHKLDRELMMWQLRVNLVGARFKNWEMPLTQMGGLHVDFPALFSNQPFNTAKDFQDYLARLHAFPKAMADTMANMRVGMKDGLMPPKLVVEDVIAQVGPMTEGDSARAPFIAPLEMLPATLTTDEKAKIAEQVNQAIDHEVIPAYQRLLAFLKKDYLPKALPKPGAWALPGGAARYAYDVKVQTTTSLTPLEIHDLGIAEVSRIETEMRAIAQSQGFPNLASFQAEVAKDPRFHPKDGADLVARYQHFVDGMRPELPKLFRRLPKAPLVVVPMEAFRAQGAAAADYNTGTPDGSRPGRISINTYEAATRSTLTCESTAYHEAIPGHHLQLSIAQELPGLPEFRRHLSVTAFEEGWALYSERLGKDVGFYQDPYSDYGRLCDEMLRAIRLVVDTGVHSLHWTRQQMVDYFHAHGTFDEVDVQSETDRYIAWPGQALAYKVGQLTILRLREKAKKELGAKFDIRAFHDEVLGAGALPMDVLERRVNAWIEKGEN